MASIRPMPDRDRMSSVAALVLLSYMLMQLIELPTLSTSFAVFGVLIELKLSTRLVMLTLAAGLAAAGSDWIVRSHPLLKTRSSAAHAILPGLAAFEAGAILDRIERGPALWVALALTAILLMAVMAAEFLTCDRDDRRFDPASMGLRTLAFLLLVGALFALQAADLRAIFNVPATMLISFGVVWRLLQLMGAPGRKALPMAAFAAWISAQIAWALHYWPLTPLRTALLLGLSVYLSNAFLEALLRGELARARWIEMAVVGASALGAILILT